MAELNEVFIFNKDLHRMLPLEEGKISIFGVNPKSIFNDGQSDLNNNNLFRRETYNS